MRKATKTIISFAVVLIAGLNFIVPAFAQDPFTAIAVGGLTGASGAGLFGSMAGMSGIDIGWNTVGTDPMDAMWNVLNPDHVYFSGEKHEADPQTDPEDVWDYITVDLGDWLEAQQEFISEFCDQYQVEDNDSGSISSVLNYYGVPDGYEIPPTLHTFGNYYIPGNLRLEFYRYNNVDILAVRVYDVNGYNSYNILGGTSISGKIKYVVTASNLRLEFYNGDGSFNAYVNMPNSYTPTTVNWTSGTVNTHVFDGWENAKVKIPHSVSGLSPNWDIPEFLGAINTLWANNQQGQIVIEDTDQPVPPPPIPSDPLGEVPFDDWIDLWGQGIYQQLENQSDALDLIGSNGIDAIEELESIDNNTEDLVEVAESIDTNIGVGNGILGGIRSLAQSAVNYLEGIAEHVGELVEEIVEGTETLIAGILNQIPQAFSVIFGPIKQASSIWHYVVEWITSIGAPFQFIWSMASGTSYYIILPVYASLAAAVVLAFFKRFGR